MKSAAFTVVVLVVGMLSTTGTSQTSSWGLENVRSFEQCEVTFNEIEKEDRATIVNDSSSRLHATWLSQECEVRAGPEYIIRKYTFFENGTFLLLRYHYDDMSCSMPTHTVSIRGSIKLLGPSSVVSGATETKFYINAVHIIPLNRQVAHKFEQKMNTTCGPQPRWRPYVSRLIYEQLRQHSATQPWHSPVYNSLQTYSLSKKRLGMDCLDTFKIGFGELKLLRVQKRLFLSKTFGGLSYHGRRLELLLASPAPNVSSRRTYKATSLQPTLLVHTNTTGDCPICGSISRATELSPPLLHVMVPLPALIGGYWLSERCESSEGGIWFRRQLQVYSGDKLWTGQWEYYEDPLCSMFLYAITAAGSYIQRPGRERRHEQLDGETFASGYFQPVDVSARLFFKRSARDVSSSSQSGPNQRDTADEGFSSKTEEESSTRADTETLRTKDKKAKRPKKLKRWLTDNVYQFLLDVQPSPAESRFKAMLRGHQTHETTSKKPVAWNVPSGSTELDLHIAESSLIPGDATVANRCDAYRANMPLTSWPRNCVPRVIEAPSTLGLRAKMGVNWNGQYILLLGLRDDNVWDAPLRQCAQIPTHNPTLRTHLRRSVGLRFGLLSAAASASHVSVVWLLVSQLLLLYRFLYRMR
ncbi:protein APCDD1 [Harpegnathos saltator]|uniref:Protein APCDD1 n=1 Tax=Harpegnathos saltator TaxID=610380 RepID=E2C548_HARSA|nr:protein APCDD1 [Harpegnathos saltator]EFN76956.1 Protein APCDD1 [Harpegnathos saltator]